MRLDKDSAGIVAAHIMRVCLYACTEGGGGGGGSGGCGSGGMEALGKQHMAHRMLALRYAYVSIRQHMSAYVRKAAYGVPHASAQVLSLLAFTGTPVQILTACWRAAW